MKGCFKHRSQPVRQVAINCEKLSLLVEVVDVQRKCGRSIILDNPEHITHTPYQPMKNTTSKKFVTASVGSSSIVTAVKVRDHEFKCDETEAYGGHDQYPDPYDYILSGLASCVAITLRQFADRHNLPLESAKVQCSYEKQDISGSPKKDKITKSITLVGQLSEQDRARLMRAATCPAHMMLDRGIEIETLEVEQVNVH